MLRPMFGFRAKPRKFDMPLRYYDPKKDERRRQRMRIEIKRNRDRHRAQNIRILIYALGLALVVWIISIL